MTITLKDVQAAKERIKDIIHITPIMESKQLSEMCGNYILLKSEHLQKTGSFKIRGSSNKVIQSVKEGVDYVVTASSGNHGQGVAYIANHFGIKATIITPEDVSVCKMNAMKSYNGKIVHFGKTSTERINKAKEIATQEQGVFIPPYDDPAIMAGQGTVGLEILEQVPDVDAIIAPIGGGGLISGILTAVKETNPNIKVIGVEPEIANDTYLSLKKKKIISVNGTEKTIADGIRTSQPGDLTFPVMMTYLDDIVLVSEDEIRQALRFVLERMKQLIEPSSATTIAAAMFGKIPLHGKKVVTVVSGGNVDLSKVQEMLS